MTTDATARWRWFSTFWGLAVLFHVLNTGPTYRIFSHPTATAGWGMAVAVVGLALFALPGRPWALVALAAIVPVLAWLEAPVVGNHWLVVALISLGFAATGVVSLVRHGRLDRVLIESTFVPVARGVFFVFYTFSALSKINRAFLAPVVSCGTFFTDETAHSLGWRSLDTAGSGFAGRVVAVSVIVIELGVVTLLAMRRTRVIGVFVAVVFHGIIGLDGYHSFADFSCLVYSLVLLFLPQDFFAAVREWSGPHASRVGMVLKSLLGSALAFAIVMQGFDLSPSWAAFDRHLKITAWRLVSLAAVLVVGRYLMTRRWVDAVRSESATVVPPMRWLLVVPLLAFLNGVTPYVGVKTAYSWNMYSNLVTAPGYENGLLFPSSWHWTNRQGDLVAIESSSDPGLDAYASQHYLVAFTTLRAYTSTHPDASVVYLRGASTTSVEHTRQDPDLGRPVAAWERRLFAYRAVDTESPARCQDHFLPAS